MKCCPCMEINMKILSPNWELLSIEDNEGFSCFVNSINDFMSYYTSVVPNIVIILRSMILLDINLKPYHDYLVYGRYHDCFDLCFAETDVPTIAKYISGYRDW